MDFDSYQSIQYNSTKSPKRSILTDHTNTNLLDNTRKRPHTSSTGKSNSSRKEIPEKKRPKQDPPPANTYASFFSLFRNPFSIFYQWNPVKDKTPTKPPDTLTTSAPKPKPQQPMQAPPDPLLGVNPPSTIGPTIKPWAHVSVKRDIDDLSSILTVNQRNSVSRNIFQTGTQTPSNKTIFKNDLFTRKQNDSYLQLLTSKSIPTDILTSTPKPEDRDPPLSTTSNAHDLTQFDTFEIPNSKRLSSTLHDPPQNLYPDPLSSNRPLRGYAPVPVSHIKPPPSRNASLYHPPKYDILSNKPISLHTHTPSQYMQLPRHTPRYKPAPYTEQDDIHIVSVNKTALAPAPPCILSATTNNAIGMIRRDFDLNRIKKEFEEEELNAFNRKLILSELERKQTPAPYSRPARTRGKTSIDELKEKMDRLVYTVESDIEDSRMPRPYKPIDLGDVMESRISNALVTTPIEEVLSSGYRIHIKRKDMSTLQPSQWLNDEVINFYCSMIADRSTQQTRAKPLPTVHTFNTFFYTQLKDRGYDSIKRWTRKVDIFSLDIITIPIHLGMHWCMAIIDFRGKTIIYYDSFLGSNSKCLNLLFDYLHKERQDKKGEELDTLGWKLIHEKEIPEQKNSSDCGVFACQFAEFITRDAAINFTQEDMPHLRRQMVAEVLNKMLYH